MCVMTPRACASHLSDSVSAAPSISTHSLLTHIPVPPLSHSPFVSSPPSPQSPSQDICLCLDRKVTAAVAEPQQQFPSLTVGGR